MRGPSTDYPTSGLICKMGIVICLPPGYTAVLEHSLWPACRVSYITCCHVLGVWHLVSLNSRKKISLSSQEAHRLVSKMLTSWGCSECWDVVGHGRERAQPGVRCGANPEGVLDEVALEMSFSRGGRRRVFPAHGISGVKVQRNTGGGGAFQGTAGSSSCPELEP